MEKFPIEIKELDLCKIDGRIYEVFKIDDEMSENITAFDGYNGMLIFDYCDCDDSYYNYVKEVDNFLEFITSVYRLIGKDYVCIFERR